MKSSWLPSIGGAALVIVTLVFLKGDYPPSADAMSAHGNERKSMVTVPLDSGLEAVVTLDHLTGDLTGYVLNRVNGQFFIQYRYNVTVDFPETEGDYLLVAGMADFRGFRDNERVASGVVYVAESNSTQVAAYALPWNTQLAVSGASPQQRTFIPLDRARTRFSELR
jgi:hypothetical protein